MNDQRADNINQPSRDGSDGAPPDSRTTTAATHSPHQTVAPRPRDRVFLIQSWWERLCCSLWYIAWLLLFRPTPLSFNLLRIFVLRCFGARIGRSCLIHPTVHIEFPWNLTIERNVVLEHRIILNCMGKVRIGEGTRISQYAHLCAGTHDYTHREMTILRRPIDIGTNVWIAADTFVGPGVRIGDGALLAARSSAFGDLPPGQVCIGEPARPRKPRFIGATPAQVALEHT